jgi:dihydrofolate reductase
MVLVVVTDAHPCINTVLKTFAYLLVFKIPPSMMQSPRSVVLYIATSLDGYIAKPNNDLSFLNLVQKEGEDYGYAQFNATVDTIIIGRKTYDWIIEATGTYPHADKTSYVITRTYRPAIGSTVFYTGNLSELVHQLKSRKGKNIFCDGGAEVVNALLRLDLIDEMIISIVPVLTGNGIKLFNDGRPEQLFELANTQTFDTGLVQLHYIRKRLAG